MKTHHFFYIFITGMFLSILGAGLFAFSGLTYVYEGYGLQPYVAAGCTLIFVVKAYLFAHLSHLVEQKLIEEGHH